MNCRKRVEIELVHNLPFFHTQHDYLQVSGNLSFSVQIAAYHRFLGESKLEIVFEYSRHRMNCTFCATVLGVSDDGSLTVCHPQHCMIFRHHDLPFHKKVRRGGRELKYF